MGNKAWNKRTGKEVEEIVNNLGYILIDDYMNRGHRRVVIQDEWGYKYDVVIGGLIDGYVPNFVSKANPKTLENISLWLLREEKQFILCDGNEYKGNKEKIWFHCLIPECNENFDMDWNHIYSREYGCPYCSGQRVSNRNRLSIVRADIAFEWDCELNQDTPEDVSYGSDKKRFWKCPMGHESYPATIATRTNMDTGCPRCSGITVSDDNRLSVLYEKISSEWDYNLNEDTPNDVSFGCNESRWWLCLNGHKSYQTRIGHRTNMGSGCPRCADEQKESKIATELKRWCSHRFKKNFNEEYNIIRNPETNAWLWYDIYIGEYGSVDGIYIEVHGPQHFKFSPPYHRIEGDFEDSKYRDKIKKKFAEKNGFYIEVDLRKIKTTEQAIDYVENIIRQP